MDSLADALAQWFNFFDGYDPSFTAAVPNRYQALTQALGAYAAPFVKRSAACRRVPDSV